MAKGYDSYSVKKTEAETPLTVVVITAKKDVIIENVKRLKSLGQGDTARLSVTAEELTALKQVQNIKMEVL